MACPPLLLAQVSSTLSQEMSSSVMSAPAAGSGKFHFLSRDVVFCHVRPRCWLRLFPLSPKRCRLLSCPPLLLAQASSTFSQEMSSSVMSAPAAGFRFVPPSHRRCHSLSCPPLLLTQVSFTFSQEMSSSVMSAPAAGSG